MRRTRLGIVWFVAGIAAAAVLLPAGVTAATGKDVFAIITDPADPTHQATVTGNGALKVDVGNFPVAAAAPTPFQAGTGSSGIDIPDGEVAAVETFTVPAGKRLVIQHVSGQAQLPSGQKPFGVIVDTTVGGELQRHFLQKLEQKSVATYFQFGEEITVNADPGTTVRVVFSRFGSGNAGEGSFQWAVSGYLVDA